MMSDDELRANFESFAEPVLGAKRASQIAERVQSIERCGNVAELMRLTSRPRAAPASGRKRARGPCAAA